MQPQPALEIPNLLYRYANAMDAGRLDDAAALFDHGVVRMGDQTLRGRDALVAMWRRWMHLYEDDTPRTRHLITNPLIDLAQGGGSAHCQSQWTVLQQVPGRPLNVIATGRYDDRLAVIGGRWCFTERRYAGIDLAGDLSAHLLQPLNPKES